MNRRIPPRTRRAPGAMNKTEARYAAFLEGLKRGGEVLAWQFEAVKLKLAKLTFYTPDFMVTYPDRIEFHEVKGHWEDDARVKIKVAAQMFPEFLFVAVKREKKGWIYEEF